MANDDLELLHSLDRVLMSKSDTALDALRQAIVLSTVAEEDSITTGPLTRMFIELQNLKRVIELEKVNRYQNTPGTYWTTNTMGGSLYSTGTIGSIGAVGTVGSMDSTQSYAYDPVYSGGYVMPASPTDPDAFVLTDPDTGDSMSVKYK